MGGWDAAGCSLAQTPPSISGSGRSVNYRRNELSGFSLGPVKSGLLREALALRLSVWFRISQGWKPALTLCFAGKVCLLGFQVLLKHSPAKLAGGCAPGHGAGTNGLAKCSPAAATMGLARSMELDARTWTQHCPGRLPAAAASSPPARTPCCDPAAPLPDLPARADGARSGPAGTEGWKPMWC